MLRARGRRTRLEVAAERGLTPRVGRDRELATLLDLFQQAKAGHGQVVSITGEACIGKSRLVLECRRALAAAGEPVTWLEGQCLSFGQAIPFLPVVDQLRANFGIEEADGEPEIIAKSRTACAAWAPSTRISPPSATSWPWTRATLRSAPWNPRRGASGLSMPC